MIRVAAVGIGLGDVESWAARETAVGNSVSWGKVVTELPQLMEVFMIIRRGYGRRKGRIRLKFDPSRLVTDVLVRSRCQLYP